jgi:hypothetical protein
MLLSVARGETKSWLFEVRDSAGALVDLTGAKIYFSLSIAGAVVITKRNTAAGGSDNEIQVVGLGQARLKFARNDTKDREATSGLYDFWVVTSLGEYIRVVGPDQFAIAPVVTMTFPNGP